MFVVRFQGGFANQIFQYALLLKLKELFPAAKVLADLSHYKTCKDHGGFKLNRFVRLKQYRGHKKNNFEIITETNCYFENLDVAKDYYFNGYWQERRFFPKDMSLIKSIFSEVNLLERNRNYLNEINETVAVSVHIRRGDYVNNFMHGNIANQCYLQNSIDYIKGKVQDASFFIFSDDIEWAKSNLQFGDSKVTFVCGNSDNIEQDIILMSHCKHNIISNSSFSWWAQFLNSNPEKIVITPEYWFNQNPGSAKYLFVAGSIKIPNTPTVDALSQQPFFSILIPVYNTEMTLRRTLSSVLNQTFADIEVIVVDDGSTDGSFDILKTYKERDSRIRIIKHPENKGLLSARITGMKNAHGKYILFLDSDDWYELDACQILHDELLKNPVDMLEFGYIKESIKEKEPIKENYNNRLKAILTGEYYHTFWNKAYSYDLVKKALVVIEDFRCTFSEDAYFSVVFACFATSIGYVDSYLHHYMVTTGISTRSEYSIEEFSKIIDDAKNVLRKIQVVIAKLHPQYLDYLEDLKAKRAAELRFNAGRVSDLANMLKLCIMIDNNFGTSYYEKEIEVIKYRLYCSNSIYLTSVNKLKKVIRSCFDLLIKPLSFLPECIKRPLRKVYELTWK